MRVISYTPAALLTGPQDIDASRDPQDRSDPWKLADEAAEKGFKPLDSQQAAAIRQRHPTLSPRRVVACQTVAGIASTTAAAVWGTPITAASVAWGVAVVVLPNALMAWRLRRDVPSGEVGLSSFLGLEIAKLGLSVAILMGGVFALPGMNWLALLAAMLVCMKVNWLALLWRAR